MKVRKTGAILAKALLLTSSLLVVNNMCAMKKSPWTWALTVFVGSKRENFVSRNLINKSTNPVKITLSIPSKRLTYTFTLKPKKGKAIPSRFIKKGDIRNGEFIFVSVGGGKRFLMADPLHYNYVIPTNKTTTVERILNPSWNSRAQKGRREVYEARLKEHGLRPPPLTDEIKKLEKLN